MQPLRHFPLLLALLTTLFTGRSRAADPPEPVGGKAMVWRIDGGKSPVYLAGSIHLLRESDYPLPAPFEEAYAASSRLVMELAPGAMEKPEAIAMTRKLALLPDGKLQDHIRDSTWSALRTWGAKSGVPANALERMRPWMAGLTVAVTAYQKLGFDGALGLEKHFTARAGKDKKPVAGLETPEQQIGLFTGLDASIQEEMILQALADAADGARKVEKLSTAWKTGDSAGLDSLLSESFVPFPELEKRLLTDRNKAWLPEMETMLKGGETVLVIVGAGHLTGKNGVIQLLREKGYTAVQIPAAPAARKKAA